MTIDLDYFNASMVDNVEFPKSENGVSQAILLGMISRSAKKSAIERMATKVANKEQWDWLAEYTAFPELLAAATAENDNIISFNENVRTEEQLELIELPVEPVRPSIKTGVEYLTALGYYSDIFKAERSEKVNSITVEVDGMVFDGDEDSQNRMSRTITAMTSSGMETTKWKLANNTSVEVTVKQLGAALLLAGQEQTKLWGLD